MALLATIKHGPLLPTTDDHGHDALSKLFCDASTYALTEEEAREVIGSSDAAFRLYLKVLLLAGTFKLRCDLPVTARVHFQNMVFHVACKTKKILDHLGLQMHESILDQYVFFILCVKYIIGIICIIGTICIKCIICIIYFILRLFLL